MRMHTDRPRPEAGEERPVALTIAGSDSGGGAGIQMDLNVFAVMGVFGTSALTCVTAQNPGGVHAVEAMPAGLVDAQIRAVCEGFPVVAAKTGMLYSAEIIRAVARCAALKSIRRLVIDPVMVSAAGDPLLQPDAVDALCSEWLPRADVITPNLPEAEMLWGRPIRTIEALQEAAAELAGRFGAACLAKGGHLPGDVVHDVWADGEQCRVLSGPRLDGADTHGAGCALSAALTAALARGANPFAAACRARELVFHAMAHPLRAGRHRPLNASAGTQPGNAG